MKKTNIFSIIVIGIILVIGGLLIFSDKILLEKNEITLESTQIEVILTIDDGVLPLRTFEKNFKEGMTAFDLLKSKTEESGLILKTKSYDIGVFIEAIGDKENGQEGKYWLYYVNGEMPQISVDKKELNPGDKVEFKFEKSPF